MIQPCQRGLGHADHPGLSRSRQHPAYRPLREACTGSIRWAVQGL